ncbi:unnamed protein product [Ceratitis capitata]|uniref:(Mediterranean fruit fly) hypothetical protein n=1 Tax=Ceratitis capitata TaxID=7213 RepID=A0A811UM52_CERCA|nr:unnamed protein product [Ceratitis capitata]
MDLNKFGRKPVRKGQAKLVRDLTPFLNTEMKCLCAKEEVEVRATLCSVSLHQHSRVPSHATLQYISASSVPHGGAKLLMCKPTPAWLSMRRLLLLPITCRLALCATKQSSEPRLETTRRGGGSSTCAEWLEQAAPRCYNAANDEYYDDEVDEV